MLGSCFAENIGEKMKYFKFRVDINPCGIVYNPLSVASTLCLLMEGKPLEGEELLQNDGKWCSVLHHGSFSSPDKETCLKHINERLIQSAENLKALDCLIITLGTAWVYRFLATGKIVANCHKIPASAFERSRLSVKDMVDEYVVLVNRLRQINPGVKIVFTVSPIRHWKDGAHGNQLSKSVLLLAIDELVNRLEGVSYFPSYELVMDELRDYRFYAEDMLHVSSQAVEYIWEKFCDVYIAPESVNWMKRIDKVNKVGRHRPTDGGDEKCQILQEKARIEMEDIKRSLNL